MNGRRALRVVALLLFAAAACACSIPNLESPDCADARLAVREFYSFHFANDMRFSAENLEQREKFLTPEYAASLRGRGAEGDVFTTGDTDFAKAFRVGTCEIEPSGHAKIGVLLFWKDDARTEQRQIFVDAAKPGGEWLVNGVSQK